MVDGQNFLDQPVKTILLAKIITNNNIQDISSSQGDDYITLCLLDSACLKKHYKMIATDFSKQQQLDAHPEVTNKLVLLIIQTGQEM